MAGGVGPRGPGKANTPANVVGPNQSGAGQGLVNAGTTVNQQKMDDLMHLILQNAKQLNAIETQLKQMGKIAQTTIESISSLPTTPSLSALRSTIQDQNATNFISEEFGKNSSLTNSTFDVIDLLEKFEENYPNATITSENFIKLCNNILPTSKDT